MRGADPADLERIYRERYGRLLRVATAITGDEESGHDAVQEGFASALRERKSYRGTGSLEAWVWRTVVNAARRARARREPTIADASPEAAANGTADASPVRVWVAALPERQRLAVFLRYYADLDYRSIAYALDVEVGTVSATLSSAHAALRKRLAEVKP